jgi:hypothetical protein
VKSGIEGLKIYMSMALTAHSLGDDLRFYYTDPATASAANFTRVMYGERF